MSSIEQGGAGARTIKLLEYVAGVRGEVNITRASEALGLPVSTVHRLLNVLMDAGLLERAGSREYRASLDLYRLGLNIVSNYDLPRLVRPTLRALVERWGESAATSVYRPRIYRAAVLETVYSRNPLRFTMEAFDEFELVWGPQGRAILAHLTEEEFESVIASTSPAPHTGATPPTREELVEILEEVRRRGCAVFVEREIINFAGVAAPIFGPNGIVLGCVGVIMPANRYDDANEDEMVASIKEAAGSLTEQLSRSVMF